MDKVIVIGGGPAGMMAAATAGNRGHQVILLEKNEKLGKKLFLTGKGRCNLTNNAPIEDFFGNITRNCKFLYSALYSFSNTQLINLIERLGVKTKVERGGRVFPLSNKSSDVIRALEKYLEQNSVKVIRGQAVKLLTSCNSICGVKLNNNQEITADRVIIATGGLSYPATGSTGDGYKMAQKLGHNITELRPSLVPLIVEEEWVNELRGLTLKNIEIKIYRYKNVIYEDFGELEFIENGISGPVVLSASTNLHDITTDKYRISIDLKPALTEEKLDQRLQRDFKTYSRKIFANSLSDLLPVKIIPVIIDKSIIPFDKQVNQITREERLNLVKLLKGLTLHIKNYRPVKEAIITSGGIDVEEINPGTMESRLVQGLFFAGEVIDVDAYTGGYNLQIAFSTGYLAGVSC